MEQGGPITASAPINPELKRFVDQLVKRTEKIKAGEFVLSGAASPRLQRRELGPSPFRNVKHLRYFRLKTGAL